ncbi:MAG TPA: GNAT family N-acetyltransferase [Solirubrobacterales bacterium]|nr:GNAT family N-acetyltransferase [Solirubrobacterales bacterium]
MIWPPPDRALEGQLVRLEPLTEAHREPLRSVAGHPEIWQWIDRRVSDEDGFDDHFQERLDARRAGTEHGYATLRAGSDEPLGSSSFLAPRPIHDGVEVGATWLTPSAWRTGVNVEAKLLMLGFAFEELGCIRVELKTDARNERSRGAMEALPARFEGIFRKHMLMPVTGVRDSAYFSIVDDEWPSVRQNLEQRLAGAREVGSA